MSRTRRILLAEDDRELRIVLARHLRLHGFEVTDVRDGTAALARLGSEICTCGQSHYDLLISDVHMPGHSGFDLACELRRSRWAMPVVLITGFGSPEVHDTAERLHVALFDKPVNFAQLTHAIERLLD
jgi:DNA-binding response OmpR family regulator